MHSAFVGRVFANLDVLVRILDFHKRSEGWSAEIVHVDGARFLKALSSFDNSETRMGLIIYMSLRFMKDRGRGRGRPY